MIRSGLRTVILVVYGGASLGKQEDCRAKHWSRVTHSFLFVVANMNLPFGARYESLPWLHGKNV